MVKSIGQQPPMDKHPPTVGIPPWYNNSSRSILRRSTIQTSKLNDVQFQWKVLGKVPGEGPRQKGCGGRSWGSATQPPPGVQPSNISESRAAMLATPPGVVLCPMMADLSSRGDSKRKRWSFAAHFDAGYMNHIVPQTGIFCQAMWYNVVPSLCRLYVPQLVPQLVSWWPKLLRAP